MEMNQLLPIGLITAAFFAPQTTWAQLQVSTLYAGGITWGEIVGNLVGTLGNTIFYVSASVFIVGALLYTSGFFSEENKSKGKSVMIGALTGMVVTLSAMAIFNTILYYLYG